MNNIIKYRGYHGVVSFDADSNIFYGRAIGLNGDEIIFEGETVAELKADFAAGIDHYLDVCEQTGKHPAKPFVGHTSISIPLDEDAHVAVAAAAAASGKTAEQWIHDVILSATRS